MRLIKHTLIRNVWLRSWISFIAVRLGGCWYILVISGNGTPWKDDLIRMQRNIGQNFTWNVPSSSSSTLSKSKPDNIDFNK
jgi:hypothetical protein